MTRGKVTMTKENKNLLQDTEGLSFVEYLIVLCVVALLGFAAWQAFGTQVSDEVDRAEGLVGTFQGNSTVN